MKKLLTFTLLSYLLLGECQAQQQADSAFYAHKKSKWLAKKTGRWQVIMTIQPTIDAKPTQIKDLEAVRTMIGAFCLNEVMQPVKGAKMPLFKRIGNLDYNLNDARWDYMSIDTRITAGIMNFIYVESKGDSITSSIADFPHPGFGPKLVDRGKNVKVRNVIITTNNNHDIVKQYWTLTDGKEWLAVKYEFTRAK